MKHETELGSSHCGCSHTSIECHSCIHQCNNVTNNNEHSKCNCSAINNLSENNLNVKINKISGYHAQVKRRCATKKQQKHLERFLYTEICPGNFYSIFLYFLIFDKLLCYYDIREHYQQRNSSNII